MFKGLRISGSEFIDERANLAAMTAIERSIQVNYELRVYFTQNAFDSANLVLASALLRSGDKSARKVLVIMDEALAQSRPDLASQIEDYFTSHSNRLKLVCSPLIIEGGERTKNSYFHVSEIHSHIDRY